MQPSLVAKEGCNRKCAGANWKTLSCASLSCLFYETGGNPITDIPWYHYHRSLSSSSLLGKTSISSCERNSIFHQKILVIFTQCGGRKRNGSMSRLSEVNDRSRFLLIGSRLLSDTLSLSLQATFDWSSLCPC